MPIKPCPSCGGGRLKLCAKLSLTIGAEILRVKAKVKGVRRPLLNYQSKIELFRKTQRWRKVRRYIHRGAMDLYIETITDLETGKLEKHVCQPLSEHQGHGTAKRKTPEDPGLEGESE